MTTIGEALVESLVKRGVDIVFGIPGVHTLELYRGVTASGIRHIAPRHEQGAGFMADGYARVSGKPGVAFVISGPGLTNILTAMAQARSDSVPLIVVSGVNTLPSLGKGLGHLHELQDQQAAAAAVATMSLRIENEQDLETALDKVFAESLEHRPGPTHVELPIDVAKHSYAVASVQVRGAPSPKSPPVETTDAVALLKSAKRPVILAGGGVRRHDGLLTRLASCLDAPTVLTTNARGLMHRHPLVVPASPSLASVRQLVESADIVLALGTELGPTDYDIYATGTMPVPKKLIRIDISADQLRRRPSDVAIHAESGSALKAILAHLPKPDRPSADGAERAKTTRSLAYREIGPQMRAICQLLETLRDAAPNSIMVGDSTQMVYAGNFYFDHDGPGNWFNSATGYGALGYAIPAAIGAALARPGHRVLCLTGDGGAQFSLPELGVAVDENLPIVFIVWNNRGYREIAVAMEDAGMEPVGCDATPPDFKLVAASVGLNFQRCRATPPELRNCLRLALSIDGPVIIEVDAVNNAT